MEPGTVAVGSLLVKVTTEPPAGAAAASTTSPRALTPPTNTEGFTSIVAMVTGVG